MGHIINVYDEREVDVEATQRLIAREWEERRPDKATPGGYAPSAAFSTEAQRLQSVRATLGDQLTLLMRDNKPIQQQQIENLKILERLCFQAETDPQGGRRRDGMAAIEKGLSPSHGAPLLSTKLQAYANGFARKVDSGVEVDHLGLRR